MAGAIRGRSCILNLITEYTVINRIASGICQMFGEIGHKFTLCCTSAMHQSHKDEALLHQERSEIRYQILEN